MENNKKILYLFILILILISIMLIGTYALSIWKSKQNTQLALRISNIEGCIVNEGIGINVSNVGPVFDYKTDGEITEFSIINADTEEINVDVNFNINAITESLKQESFKYVIMTSTNGINYSILKEDKFIDINNNSVIEILNDYKLIGSLYFRLYIYIDANMQNQVTMQNGNLTGNISINACEETRLLLTAEQVLENLGLTLNTSTPNFNNISTTNEGIFAQEDDLGTSYYFRGNVTNNYVYFAELYFRIIRINGDGSIRIIYDGTTAHSNGDSSTDRQITTSAFNTSYNSNTFVGYMTGTSSASTYETTHSNTTDSTIKTVIDNWYKTNIVDKGYSKNVVDAIYCNDRETSSGNGIGTNTTYYKAHDRLNINKTPSLKCTQVNDRFTVNTTIKNIQGNGKLKYPVGLITADEVAMAGGKYDTSNSSYYLYTGNYFWTMTPGNFYYGNASEFGVYGDSFGYDYVDYQDGIRPVITLLSSSIKSGSGTKDNPFTLN